MFRNISKSFLLVFAGIILGAGVLMGGWAVDALNAPPSNPPLGSGTISVDSSGRVGIATTTPSNALTVAGRIQTSRKGADPGGVMFPDGTVQTTAAGAAAILADNVASGVFGALQGNGFYSFPSSLGVNTTTKTGLPQALSVYGSAFVSGRVGIGAVSAPQAALEVGGTVRSTNVDVSPTTGKAIEMYVSGGTTGVIRSYDSTLNQQIPIIIAGHPVQILDNANTGLIITQNAITLGSTSTNATGYRSIGIGSQGNIQGSYSIGIALNNSPYTLSQSNALAIMGGSVGIGTTTPSYALDVQGVIRGDTVLNAVYAP